MNQILLPKVFQEGIKHECTYIIQPGNVCLKTFSISKSTLYNISITLAKMTVKLFLLNDLYWENFYCITRYYIRDANEFI